MGSRGPGPAAAAARPGSSRPGCASTRRSASSTGIARPGPAHLHLAVVRCPAPGARPSTRNRFRNPGPHRHLLVVAGGRAAPRPPPRPGARWASAPPSSRARTGSHERLQGGVGRVEHDQAGKQRGEEAGERAGERGARAGSTPPPARSLVAVEARRAATGAAPPRAGRSSRRGTIARGRLARRARGAARSGGSGSARRRRGRSSSGPPRSRGRRRPPRRRAPRAGPARSRAAATFSAASAL